MLLVRRTWAGDAVDINVRLYSDPNCFSRSDEAVLIDKGCYANRYDDATKAFELKIVVYDGDQQVDMREYVNDCDPAKLYRPARTMKAGRCERFVGGFYAVLGLRLRSTACEGVSCSPISVAVQSFYASGGCQGVPLSKETFPLQSECMRWWNGTRILRMDPNGREITQIDYPGNDKCNGATEVRYSMTSGTCFPLFGASGPRSFLWVVEKGKNVLASASRSAALPNLALAALAAIVSSCVLRAPG